MNQIQAIKKEIERRTEILTRIYAEMVERKDDEMRTYYHGKIVALEEFLSFIESLEKEQEPKIKGWVARDKDGQLGVYDILPIRGNICWYPQVRFENWVLPENAFPDLKWEDEPIEVELTINIV